MTLCDEEYMWARAVVFVDMNAFFASIEQLDEPACRDKPVAVTNGGEGTCIITSSYEARRWGIKTGMRLREAKKLCPNLIVRASRHGRYAAMSQRIMQSLEAITPDIEVFSVDEAFLEVTRCQRLWGEPEFIGRKVKKLVEEISQLPCSVGVSGDKSTAKFAANLQKPNGFVVIRPEEAREKLAKFAVTELCGIGPGIARFLARYGVYTCGDMRKLPMSVLAKRFGNLGRKIWLMTQGLDIDPVRTSIQDPKSMGHGKVMPPNTRDEKVVLTYLQHMCVKLAARLRRHNFTAQTYFIGVKSYAWGWLGEKKKLPIPTNDAHTIYRLGREIILERWDKSGLFQIQVTALDPIEAYIQKDLFENDDEVVTKLNEVVDEINQRFGSYTIAPAPLLNRSKMHDVISPAWKPDGHRRSTET